MAKKHIPLLTLLVVIAIVIGIYLVYGRHQERFDELKDYLYGGAFLASLILNATVILPAGSMLIIATLGAALPSATLVGLAGGTGAAIGEITGYMAGYSGHAIIRSSRTYSRVEVWMSKWGAITIFIFSLVPLIFDLVGIAAGVIRFPLWRFLFACWLGRTVLYIGIALAGAQGWEAILRYFG